MYNLTDLRMFFRNPTCQEVQVNGYHHHTPRFHLGGTQEGHISPEGRNFGQACCSTPLHSHGTRSPCAKVSIERERDPQRTREWGRSQPGPPSSISNITSFAFCKMLIYTICPDSDSPYFCLITILHMLLGSEYQLPHVNWQRVN